MKMNLHKTQPTDRQTTLLNTWDPLDYFMKLAGQCPLVNALLLVLMGSSGHCLPLPELS